MPWGLILKLIFMLPSIIPTVIKIWNLIKDFEGAGFFAIVELLQEILKLIMGLAPVKKVQAAEVANECLRQAQYVNAKRIAGKVQVADKPQELMDLKKLAEEYMDA